jgi:[acyl-carrier-protein] S-malonyltransferase
LTLPRRVVCVFPGQGAQQVGMGRDLADEFPTARRVFDEVDERLGRALSRLCFDGPAEKLSLTENAQPAILACSVAAYRCAREALELEVVALAGHSLGEWTALVAAGALDLGAAAGAVEERGRLMQAAVPLGEGAMAAVMGLGAADVAALCRQAAAGEVLSPANLNGASQIVVAGHTAAVERLILLVREHKGKVQRLPVSAPFHCALMEPAARGLAPTVAALTVRDPQVRVLTSVEARPVGDAADIRALLVAQVTSPVRWEETARALLGLEPEVMLECGPGRALGGLMRRLAPELASGCVGSVADLARLREVLA